MTVFVNDLKVLPIAGVSNDYHELILAMKPIHASPMIRGWLSTGYCRCGMLPVPQHIKGLTKIQVLQRKLVEPKVDWGWRSCSEHPTPLLGKNIGKTPAKTPPFPTLIVAGTASLDNPGDHPDMWTKHSWKASSFGGSHRWSDGRWTWVNLGGPSCFSNLGLDGAPTVWNDIEWVGKCQRYRIMRACLRYP